MIKFNTQQEALAFQEWVNRNNPMLPLLTTEPIETNSKWGFEETELVTNKMIENWYEQYINNQLYI